MTNLAVVLAVLVGGYFAWRFVTVANPQLRRQRQLALAGLALLLLAAVLMVRGMTGLGILAGSIGLGLLPTSLRSLMPSGSAGTDPSGRVSRVTTDHLEMELDLDTGDMRGRVIKGFFQDRDLKSLRPVELAHLWQDCRFTDPQSAQLVEAYLDRVHPTWRDDLARAEAAAPKGPDGKMTREEAFEILGLKPGASEADIRRAHRELMLRVHPDRGGSTYLAAKINEAKDVALTGLG